jgi:hypothetical protein
MFEDQHPGGPTPGSEASSGDASHTHARSLELAQLIEQIAQGRQAEALLPPDDRTALGQVAVWPLFVLREPAINIGRKAKSGNLHPIRIDHGGRALVESVTDGLDPSDLSTVGGLARPWSATRIQPAIGLGVVEDVRLHAQVLSASRSTKATQVLLDLMERGQAALWELRQQMEVVVAKYIAEANSSLQQELMDLHQVDRTPRPMDEVMADQVQMTLLYGRTDSKGIERAGSLDRIITKLLVDPQALAKVDLIMLITRTLRRDAWQEVRSLLGDPRVGSRVRKIAIELRTRDVRRVHAAYIERHPSDSAISLQRIAQALCLQPGVIPHALYEGDLEGLELIR